MNKQQMFIPPITQPRMRSLSVSDQIFLQRTIFT